jgi:hypothetical protein
MYIIEEDFFIWLTGTEQEVVQQYDSHSCGPFVIRNARDRMMGLPVADSTSHAHDPTKLRTEALAILQLAWKDGALTATRSEDRGRKRRPNKNSTSKAHKRRKTNREH